MDEKITLCLLVFAVALQSLANGHTFFHEPSAVLIKSGAEPKPSTDFGFSIEHWNESLIISSPTSTLEGEIYRCPLASIVNNRINCNLLNVFNTTSNWTRDLNPTQNFYLGTKIVSTKDYFFTCAPLVTKTIYRGNSEVYPDAYGSCFAYSNDTSIECPGSEYKFEIDPNMKSIAGGTGGNALVDQENGLLFVAKPAVSGFLHYINTAYAVVTDQILNDAFEVNEYGEFGQDVIDFGYGITAGKFFSKETVYAVSKQSRAMIGQIVFLEYVEDETKRRRRGTRRNEKKEMKLRLMKRNTAREIPHVLNSTVVGSMFGYCLAAADLNLDGFAELLVGAPLHSEDVDEVEFGAVHIHLGGNIDDWTDKTGAVRIIFGTKSRGRFGSAITSSDIDGDNIPEVFVSAPYEDNGVIYILSGHGLKTTLFQKSTLYQVPYTTTTQVSKLPHTQIIRSDLALFGFSIMPVPDLDGNGCDELAIGAPGAASAILLRSLQTINVTLSVSLTKSEVLDTDEYCTVRVCLNIDYNKKSKHIAGHIIIKNYIDGNASFPKPNSSFDLSTREKNPCFEFAVKFGRSEERFYEVKTELVLQNDKESEFNTKAFHASWVQLSTYSEEKFKEGSNLKFQRHCEGSNCVPLLSLNITWSNLQIIKDLAPKGIKKDIIQSQSYDVESTANETVSIFVTNLGTQATSACVEVEIRGAPVHKSGKCIPSPSANNEDTVTVYQCSLPEHFMRNESFTFEIPLNMSTLSNKDKALLITARPYEYCPQKVNKETRKRKLEINYSFKNAWKKVQLNGETQDLQITDLEISEESDGGINKDEIEVTDNIIFKAIHQFKIINDGSVKWNGAKCVIDVDDRPFITKVTTGERECKMSKAPNQLTCFVNLAQRESKTIIVWAEMSRQKVGESLNGGRSTNVTSHMKIFMDNTTKMFTEKSLVTTINFKNDILFKNNKLLIALVAGILALLLLALVTFCLFKNGFFQRKEKKKLNVLRQSVRKHSIRLASERSSRMMSHKSPSNEEDDNDIDIEVEDDSPFDEIPIGSKDDIVLIEAKADVHDENTVKGAKEEHAKKV